MDPAVLTKFIAPIETQILTQTFPAPLQRSYSSGPRGAIPLDQVPPIERGELPAFLTVARGTPNMLATTPTESAKCSLDSIWRKGMFSQAPQLLEMDPSGLGTVNAEGKLKVARMVPERFENCRVQRPQMTFEEVPAHDLFGSEEGLIHPQTRRWAHDTAVNSRLGLQCAREALRQKSKLYKACRINYPHGVLGCLESPYSGSDVYTNSAELERECQKATRKGRGGKAPQGTLDMTLTGSLPSLNKKGKRVWPPKESFSIAKMV